MMSIRDARRSYLRALKRFQRERRDYGLITKRESELAGILIKRMSRYQKMLNRGDEFRVAIAHPLRSGRLYSDTLMKQMSIFWKFSGVKYGGPDAERT